MDHRHRADRGVEMGYALVGAFAAFVGAGLGTVAGFALIARYGLPAMARNARRLGFMDPPHPRPRRNPVATTPGFVSTADPVTIGVARFSRAKRVPRL